MIRDGFNYTDNFDGVCYLNRYPDVAADGKYNTPEKALLHWQIFGEQEGRIPGCLIGPVLEDGSGDVPPPATGNNTKGLLIGGAAVLIIFHKQIAKLLGIKL